MKRSVLTLATFALLAGAFAQMGSPSKKDVEALKNLEAKYTATKKAYEAKKSEKTKKPYVDATVLFGHESMVSPALPPRQKYPQALRLFREALKLDPKNPVATKELKLIEDIYKSMGRPIPK